MSKLKYTFKTDILFKLIFTNYPHLLKKLVAHLLKIPQSRIKQFIILNPEVSPDVIGKKFSRLDILMTVNNKKVNLEVQVKDEGNYPERALFYWAKTYSGTLPKSGKYIDLQQTIVINIINFPLFKDSSEFHSEFRLLEVTRGTQLTDKQILHFFELPKLPDNIKKNELMKLWLALFKANTEEDLKMIEEMGVSEVNEVITAYRSVMASPELQEIERQLERARINEASALHHAEQSGEKRGEKRGAKAERKKWRDVVAKKDAQIAELQAKLDGKSKE